MFQTWSRYVCVAHLQNQAPTGSVGFCFRKNNVHRTCSGHIFTAWRSVARQLKRYATISGALQSAPGNSVEIDLCSFSRQFAIYGWQLLLLHDDLQSLCGCLLRYRAICHSELPCHGQSLFSVRINFLLAQYNLLSWSVMEKPLDLKECYLGYL